MAETFSIPAPVGGLNDRDSYASMPKKDAVIMENWWPYPADIAIRMGSSDHVTGFGSAVQTLVEYLPVSGTSTLFAASGTSIYNVTTAGALGAAVQTGLTNAQFQDAQITTSGGSYLYLVNGADSPRLWDGTTWVSVTGASVPAITGVTTSNLIHVCLFKNRLFFTEKNTMKLWYLPVSSVGGAAAEFNLGAVFRLGGSIMAAYPWTIDAGDGSDDHFVIISTNGEVAVYKGTDPSSATTWALVGVFVLGRPLGRRCAVKYGGDLAVNTMEGVFPLGKGLLSASVDRRIALTDKIQNTVSRDANTYASSFGWQLCLHPDQNMLLLNVPGGYQYAQNTITGAWTKFTGWASNVWLNATTGLYFGSNTKIIKAWTGTQDSGAPITADLLPAFNSFSALNKYFTMIRPYMQTTGSPSILIGLNSNYVISDPTGAFSYSPPTGMVWGSMTWGSMTWGGALRNLKYWKTVGSVATSVSARVRVMNNGAEVRLSSIDYLWQRAGVL